MARPAVWNESAMDGDADFRMAWRRSGDVVVVELEGELDAVSAPAARRGLMELVDDRATTSIRLDLERVSFIDSSGVNVLAHVYKRLADRGGLLRVVAAQPGAMRVFTVAGLASMLLAPPDASAS